MKTIKIKFKDFADVQRFVNYTNMHTGKVMLKSEEYVVNGKSIMGVFSLDLGNELDCIINDCTDLIEKLVKEFEVKK